MIRPVSRRWRRKSLVVVLAAVLGLATLARAQQAQVDLSNGDELTISCPTELSVDYDDFGGAVVVCAAAESAGNVPTEDPPQVP